VEDLIRKFERGIGTGCVACLNPQRKTRHTCSLAGSRGAQRKCTPPAVDKSNDQEEQEEEELVDKIVGKRVKNGRTEYRVRWEGFTEADDTWEPLTNLETVEDLVCKFERGLSTGCVACLNPQRKTRHTCSVCSVRASDAATGCGNGGGNCSTLTVALAARPVDQKKDSPQSPSPPSRLHPRAAGMHERSGNAGGVRSERPRRSAFMAATSITMSETAIADSAMAAAKAEQEQEEVQPVERIVGKRVKDGRTEYRVRWEGFTEADDTWEPLTNLETAKDLIRKFERGLGTGCVACLNPQRKTRHTCSLAGSRGADVDKDQQKAPRQASVAMGKASKVAGGDGDSEDGEDGREFVPEKILGVTMTPSPRGGNKARYFKVKWVGYTVPSMEPASRVCNEDAFHEIFMDYCERQKAKGFRVDRRYGFSTQIVTGDGASSYDSGKGCKEAAHGTGLIDKKKDSPRSPPLPSRLHPRAAGVHERSGNAGGVRSERPRRSAFMAATSVTMSETAIADSAMAAAKAAQDEPEPEQHLVLSPTKRKPSRGSSRKRKRLTSNLEDSVPSMRSVDSDEGEDSSNSDSESDAGVDEYWQLTTEKMEAEGLATSDDPDGLYVPECIVGVENGAKQGKLSLGNTRCYRVKWRGFPSTSLESEHRVHTEAAFAEVLKEYYRQRRAERLVATQHHLEAPVWATSGRHCGVGWDQPSGKWRDQITFDGEKQHLGYFAKEEVAVHAYARASEANRIAPLQAPIAAPLQISTQVPVVPRSVQAPTPTVAPLELCVTHSLPDQTLAYQGPINYRPCHHERECDQTPEDEISLEDTPSASKMDALLLALAADRCQNDDALETAAK
jgi:hypothetical protein